MAQTTIESGGGVGIHAFYHICQEGKLVATMTRHSSYRTPWTVYSFPYSRKLATLSKDINVARERVASLTYPTPAEQYEADCQDIARIRREKMEHAHGAHIVALSRAMLDGSNSARAELADLYEKIDRESVDRSDVHPRYRLGNNWTHQDLHNWGYFPLPPERLHEEAA